MKPQTRQNPCQPSRLKKDWSLKQAYPRFKLRKRLKEQGGVETLKGQMLREKALDYLTSVANIQYLE